MNSSNTLILGVGNTLLCDEGAGIHALNMLQSSHPDLPDVIYLDGGTLSFTLASWIEDCSNLIVFDAAELKSSPGTVKTFIGEDMDRFLGIAKRSPHEVGLLDLLDIARLTDTLPEQRALIGIQPGNMDWNTHPSDSVTKSLPVAVSAARGLLVRWNILDYDQKDGRTAVA